ncbi:MAG: 2Fe-2S iron-sulfur cluster binding domain-containing protein [SAR324 cluster bacterium]|nr:2Fe-2S iron-sulfur cluster binding domain-containing protein [SAR324 cluster bacterium]
MSYLVTIEPIGEQIEVEEGQTILDAALRSGVWLPFACGHGNCATCKIDLIDGEVDHGHASDFALMDMERQEGKILACCATPLSDLVVEADLEEEKDALRHSVGDFVGKVIAITDLTPSIKGFELEVDDSFKFQAGQYVNLTIEGVEGTRAFSIANAPQKTGILELHVRLVERGAGTTWLHENLQLGMELNFSGPYGNFFVRRSAAKPMIFIAGGSGLSSPKGMIEDLLATGCTEQITLVHGCRNPKEVYFKSHFEALAVKYKNFEYFPVVGQSSEAWEGAVGYADNVLSTRFGGRYEGSQAYLCGPPPMVDSVINSLMKGRLFERDIFMENFFNNASDAPKKGSPLFKKIS